MVKQRFHRCAGLLVQMSSCHTMADRKYPNEEFDNGLVFSENPLGVDELFCVKINKTITSWSGSIEIGLTSADPSVTEIMQTSHLPSDYTCIVSGTSVNLNGDAVVDVYCKDLDSLSVGSTVGITRNKDNEIHVLVNGVDQGTAALTEEEKLWAVVNLYGKCCSISIMQDEASGDTRADSNIHKISCSENIHNYSSDLKNQISTPETHEIDSLSFHANCGSLIRLEDDGTTAVRLRHENEFDNGVVMTDRSLQNGEMFEIRINCLTDKWSGSIEIGVTSHQPDLLEIPSTMTNLRSGTVMLSGCGIICNGRSTRRKYLENHLDRLESGDYIGLMRTSTGTLHFFINGVDQGVAANHIPPHVYGVVDLYGRAVSVSIISQHSVAERGRRNKATVSRMLNDINKNCDPIRFSTHCGNHVTLSMSNKTAMRQNPTEDFNHAVVITERPLEAEEIFSVQIDEVIPKWSGSLEIGVTVFSPDSFTFPVTMTNMRSGTWIMTSSGVMINGVTVVDDYGPNLEGLNVGHVLGVRRKANGNLHFYINGVDQGLAATDVPEDIYGVADLYGRTSKISVFENSSAIQSDCENSDQTTGIVSENYFVNHEFLRYFSKHTIVSLPDDNTILICRKNPLTQFDGSTVLLNNNLKFGKLWELEIQKIIPQWVGSLEIGVTTDSSLSSMPSSITHLNTNCWVWTGKSLFKNGNLVNDSFSHDMDKLKRGSKVGLMLTGNDVIGFIDGVNIGTVFSDVARDAVLYPIFNLYGKCAHVTVSRTCLGGSDEVKKVEKTSLTKHPNTSMSIVHEYEQSFAHVNSDEVVCLNDQKVIVKKLKFCYDYITSINFSSVPLRVGELFEILLNAMDIAYGDIAVGVVCLDNIDPTFASSVTNNVRDISKLGPSCIISGADVWINGSRAYEHFFPRLFDTDFDDRIGLILSKDNSLIVLNDGKVVGRIPNVVPLFKCPHFFVCLNPKCRSVEIVKNVVVKMPTSMTAHKQNDTKSPIRPALYTVAPYINSDKIALADDKLTVSRSGGCDHAMVITDLPLAVNSLFQFKVKSLNNRWSSSVSFGVTGPGKRSSAECGIKCSVNPATWLAHNSSIFKNGMKIKDDYGSGLDNVTVNQVLGVLIDSQASLHLYIDGVDQGIAADGIPDDSHGIVDLYGNCTSIEIVSEDWESLKCEEKNDAKQTYAVCSNLKRDFGCPTLKLCTSYLDALGIPKFFFSGTKSCFCSSCFDTGADVVKKQGDTTKLSLQPAQWCKFGLCIDPNVDFTSVSKYWDPYYYGTSSKTLRKILDVREILTENTEYFDLRESSSTEKVDRAVACISNVKFFNNPLFFDAETGKSYHSSIVIQLYVQPTEKHKTQASFRNQEWVFNRSSTTLLSHVLIKLDPAN